MRPTGWYKRNENFEVYVTHNGDLDYMEELDSKVLRTHKELGLWLQLVLQTSRSSMASWFYLLYFPLPSSVALFLALCLSKSKLTSASVQNPRVRLCQGGGSHRIVSHTRHLEECYSTQRAPLVVAAIIFSQIARSDDSGCCCRRCRQGSFS